ncbi:M23 family metallopeptidase [Micromonospora sp. WMMD998]|uniref:M23 family metallopeptidase n=1 Tax=Micromonospora sp. WMMD998 TaxID=3016092 RepID=UPI00249B38BE|nr:M23 family metallopeptidase [Micromonospora sp. WMMD998]WFE38031.1 M23 family metallopeptidase [Micromonospora sp. WMMD998]
MGRVALWVATGVAVALLLLTSATAGVVSSVFGGGGGGGSCVGAVTAPGATPAGLSAEQARNASVIVTVGERLRVPVRGWVIAVATALQESSLINHGYLGPDNDHDSLGLFQQRPSQGWGTPEQIMNPEYAAAKFYERLVTVPGWERLPLTDAAQKVQRSAYPDAYARHETRATEIVTAYTGGTLPVCDGAPISASGWTRPVAGTAGSGFRTSDRPGHDGVDIMAPKGTVIRAASGGVVVRVRCNIGGSSWDPTGGPMPCDSDGYPGLGGCGWYTEIRHAGDVVSRYCHMVRQPTVRVGQSVIAGQPIGHVGSSGNSSGPHLHYEIHEGYPATENNAVDPVPFMRQKGVAL